MSNRNFTIGRQSEQLYNEELYNLFESIKHLLEIPPAGQTSPEGTMQGSLWLDQSKNELNSYNKEFNRWDPIFKEKFQLIDQILSETPPVAPLTGQLWINQGMLWYYNGQGWNPIRAFDPESSEVYFSSFEDFLMLSPMQPQNNSVIDKNDPEAILKSQFLTPNIKTGRFYLGQEHTVDYEKMNQVAIQYPTEAVEAARPSWIHVNPARLTKMDKRIIKIDKESHSIDLSYENAEFYGFMKDSPLGDYLRPMEGESEGDYYHTPAGIVLSYDAAHKYDYLMRVQYEFSWIKSSGVLSKSDTRNDDTHYYVGDFTGPMNVFTEGFDLEAESYYHDVVGKTVNITADGLESDTEVAILKAHKNEYGFIQSRTLDGRGIIKMRKKFVNPIVFVNGQALHTSLGDVEFDEDRIYINNARKGMAYCLMELDHDGENILFETGIVKDRIDNNDAHIFIPDLQGKLPEEENIALFVDGLLVKKEDVIRDYENHLITVRGLETGQDYILLHDKTNELILDLVTREALVTSSKVDESLVFMNGHILCNDSALVTLEMESSLGESSIHGEVKLFIRSSEDEKFYGDYKKWNNVELRWEPLDNLYVKELKRIGFSYENSLQAIVLNIEHSDEDVFDCFSYNFAHTIENPLAINTMEITEADGADFEIKELYVPGSNSLQVYLDGVRLHGDNDHPSRPGVVEWKNGDGFTLPAPHTGRLTWIVERPEGGATKSCDRILLDYTDILGSPNVYKSSLALYPGIVTVYINGLRQPKESYTILDNYTIMFKDETNMIGHESNYPVQTVFKSDDSGNMAEISYDDGDTVLIEVRSDFKRVEYTYSTSEADGQEIDLEAHGVPKTIVEANDQILIYINGLFTSYRDNIEYRKDREKGVITLLDNRYSSLINYDPLYIFFQTDISKKIQFELDHGHPYEPKILNTITLEWR